MRHGAAPPVMDGRAGVISFFSNRNSEREDCDTGSFGIVWIWKQGRESDENGRPTVKEHWGAAFDVAAKKPVKGVGLDYAISSGKCRHLIFFTSSFPLIPFLSISVMNSWRREKSWDLTWTEALEWLSICIDMQHTPSPAPLRPVSHRVFPSWALKHALL